MVCLGWFPLLSAGHLRAAHQEAQRSAVWPPSTLPGSDRGPTLLLLLYLLDHLLPGGVRFISC